MIDLRGVEVEANGGGIGRCEGRLLVSDCIVMQNRGARCCALLAFAQIVDVGSMFATSNIK